MNIISLIQPSELGPDFYLDQGVWKVNFPTTATPPPPISNDARNIIQNVGDGMFVDQRNRLAYAMVQDNQTQKIQLWQFPADTVFSTDTATMVSEIDMLALNGQFDDIAIDEGVITFTDVQTGSTLTLNTNELQRVGNIKSTNTVTVTETAGVLKFSAKLDPKANNLLEVTAGGLQVAPAKIKQIFDAELAKLDVHTQTIAPHEYIGLQHVIGDRITAIPKVMLANSAGVALAMVNDPSALEMSRDYQYPDLIVMDNKEVVDGLTYNHTRANFSMTVNGQLFFAAKPDLLGEDLSIIPNTDFQIYVNSGGIMEIRSHMVDGDTTPIHVVLSPSTEQRRYTTNFEELYRDAKVLPNGDFEFTLRPYEPR